MHWPKILAFSILLVIFQVIPTTLTSYFWGVPEEYTYLRFWGELLAVAVMGFIVFVVVGLQRFSKPYIHAFIIAMLAYLITKTIVTILIGEFSYNMLSFVENFFSLMAMYFGTYVGLRLSNNQATEVAT